VTSGSSAKTLSTVLIVAGIGLILSPLSWVAYTAFRIGPSQADALAAWERDGTGQDAPGSDETGTTPASRSLLLSIPRLRLTRVIPTGASVAQLRRYGAGRISWTPLPGRPGVVGIAGHRTTYGAPFFRLGRLVPGDQILLTYDGRRFSYVVTERRVVRPSQMDVLRARPGEQMVALITCAPVYSAKYRLVVLGRLQATSPLSAVP
jgi:LPXTG-site transpeptidase (sortase) family protein